MSDVPPLREQESTPVSAPDAAPETARRPRRVRRVVAWTVVVVLSGLAWLLHGAGGQRVLLDAALSRAGNAVNGSLTVEGIHSSSLLFSATLTGVRIAEDDGTAFLTADSLRVGYSLLALLGGRPGLRSVRIWSPRVTIVSRPGDGGTNVARIFARTGQEADSAGTDGTPPSRVSGPRPLTLGRVVIADGRLEVLTPIDGPSEAMPTVVDGNGGHLRRLVLGEINADLSGAALNPAEGTNFSGAVRHLAMSAAVLEDPLQIRDAEGRLSFGTAGVVLEADRIDLPSSRLQGRIRVGPVEGGGPWRYVSDLSTTGASLADFRWLDGRIPDGTFQGRVQVAAGDGVDVLLHGVEGELEGSAFSVAGRITAGPAVRFDSLEVDVHPLSVEALEPWMGRDLPADGWVSGQVTLSGQPSALGTRGRLTLVPAGGAGRPTTVELSGTVHLGSDPGASELSVRADPLDLDVLRASIPALPVRGTGAASVSLDGRLGSGVRFMADVLHRGDSLPDSRVVVSGVVGRGEPPDGIEASAAPVMVMPPTGAQNQEASRGSDPETGTVPGGSVGRGAGEGDAPWWVDLRADLSPLDLALPGPLLGVPATGLVRGDLRVIGPLGRLSVQGDLALDSGRAAVRAEFDGRAPFDAYRLDLQGTALDLTTLGLPVPEPSHWTGSLHVAGSGSHADSMVATAVLAAWNSRLGGVPVDTLAVAARVGGGRLAADTVLGRVGGVLLNGRGGFGLAEGPHDSLQLEFSTPSLEGLRPLVIPGRVVVRDTLTTLQRMRLEFEGVDPDTLPTREEVAVEGSLSGTMTLTGSRSDFRLGLDAVLTDGVFRRQSLDRIEVSAVAEGLPGDSASWQIVTDGVGLELERWSFAGGHFEATGVGRAGRGWVELRRSEAERYGASGAVRMTETGGRVDLELATARIDSVVWSLDDTTSVEWTHDMLRVDGFRASRAGGHPARLAIDGTLARAGPVALTVEAAGLDARRLAHLLQVEDRDWGGIVDVSGAVSGTATRPSADLRVVAEAPRVGEVSAARAFGVVEYRDRSARVDLQVFDEGRTVLLVRGSVPVDLALASVEDRVPDRTSMDVMIRADSLDAAGFLKPAGFLEDVTGWVSGDLTVRGSLEEPAPAGTLRLQNAAWSLPVLGVRHRDISALLTVYPDRTVEVAAAARARGVSDVTGRIDFGDLRNPALDLRVAFQRFLAVDRLDVTGRISGEATLAGSYDKPYVRGSLAVDEGTLFLEEFARSASVIDLTDPRLMGVFENLDTLAFASRPLIAGLRNPFMDNLRVEVELAVPRDAWLRSPEMNVEIGGDLVVTYDRSQRDLVLVGDLEALRGSYSVLGRRFEVRGGTVGFIGIPGINPTLDIEAASRIRRLNNDPLEVTASVSGTLIQPRVTLSSPEQGLAESDLVSYLIFGRPTHELASEQQVALGGLSEAVGSAVTGGLATAFSAAVAQGFGLDYLSISQGDFAGAQEAQGAFSAPQIEIGQYFSEDVFVVVLIRPLQYRTARTNTLGGARVEWALSENVTGEGFIEDRFLRSRSLGIQELGLSDRVVGIFVFREWGY